VKALFRSLFVYLAGVAPVLVAGCSSSSPLVEVEGVVTIDGVPAGNLLIQFTPVDWTSGSPIVSSHAVSDANGRFVLMSTKNKAGAVVGTHKVTVVDNALGIEEEPGGAISKKLPRNRVPSLYSSATTTPIELRVEAARKEYEVQVGVKR